MLRTKNNKIWNIFREQLKRNPGLWKAVATNQRSIIGGPIEELAALFLAQSFFQLKRPIDLPKLTKLFEANGTGLVKKEEGYYWVRRKPFAQWVRRNATAICKTVAQMRAEQTHINQKYETEYRQFIEEDEKDNK